MNEECFLREYGYVEENTIMKHLGKCLGGYDKKVGRIRLLIA